MEEWTPVDGASVGPVAPSASDVIKTGPHLVQYIALTKHEDISKYLGFVAI